MTYLVMLTGAGPTRAYVERITHVVYLAHMKDDVVQVLPFEGLTQRIRDCGLHFTVQQKEGCDFVSISIPFLPRNHVRVSSGIVGGCFFPLDANNDDAARDALIAWCRTHAV